MVRTFLKVYMELGFYFLFLQEQIKDIIIIYATDLDIDSGLILNTAALDASSPKQQR